MKEHEIVNDPSEIILPHEQYQQKTQFFLMFFTNPLSIGVKAGEKIKMTFNPPPNIYIQSP